MMEQNELEAVGERARETKTVKGRRRDKVVK